jgi:hypothetical protein
MSTGFSKENAETKAGMAFYGTFAKKYWAILIIFSIVFRDAFERKANTIQLSLSQGRFPVTDTCRWYRKNPTWE